MRRRKGQPRILKKFPRLPEITQDKGLDAAGIEVWFADEARIGQKNKITRRWAKRGTRPSAPHDQRTVSAYIFGAPPKGKALGLSCPPATTRPWLCISRKSRLQSPQAHMPSFSSIRRMACLDEAARTKQTSRSCRCRRNRPSSTPSKTSGNLCPTTGSQTASSNLTKTFWTTAV